VLQIKKCQEGDLTMKWQPIETAPEHEAILVYGKSAPYDIIRIAMQDIGNEWWIEHEPFPYEEVEFTHWMPLPEPPKSKK
jgi:hypothetical protein